MRKSVACICSAFTTLWFSVTLILQPAGKSHTHTPDETCATFHNIHIEFCTTCHAWRVRPIDNSRPPSEWRFGNESFTFAIADQASQDVERGDD